MLRKIMLDSPEQNYQPGAEELELFIELMVRQKRFDDAIDALDRLCLRPQGQPIEDEIAFKACPSDVKIHNLTHRMLRISMLGKLERFSDFVDELKVVLELYPDQWDAHLSIIHGLNRLQQAGDGAKRIEHLLFLRSQQTHKQYSRLRGPALAEIHLNRTLITGASSPDMVDEMLPENWPRADAPPEICELLNCAIIGFHAGPRALVVEELCRLMCCYIKTFDNKLCCFADIKETIELVASCSSSYISSFLLSAVATWADSRRCAAAVQLENIKNQFDETSRAASEPANFDADVITPLRNAAVEILCSINKLYQISYFCRLQITDNINGTSSYVSGQQQLNQEEHNVFLWNKQQQDAVVELYYSTKHLCVGGIGGEREVQPGDELLTLLSAQHRRRVNDCLNAGAQGLYGRVSLFMIVLLFFFNFL